MAAAGDDVGVTDVEERRAELGARLAAVRERIGKACVAAGREPGEVTLVAVTKTFPASDVRLLSELGVWDVGENRDQEAAPKAAQCADLAPRLTWTRQVIARPAFLAAAPCARTSLSRSTECTSPA